MADDRELRNELEKVQAEVLRLKRALDSGEVHVDVRARIESLRRSKVAQAAKLDEARAEMAALEQRLRAVMDENAGRQAALDEVARRERALVEATARLLYPGPRRSAGCTTVVALAVIALALGAWA